MKASTGHDSAVSAINIPANNDTTQKINWQFTEEILKNWPTGERSDFNRKKILCKILPFLVPHKRNYQSISINFTIFKSYNILR